MIHQQTFTLAQIGEILEKNPSTLRTHINRGLVMGKGPRSTSQNKPAGAHARFAYCTLMEFAMAYHLHDAGVQLEKAFRLAGDFAHTSGGGAGLPTRYPGLPFHHSHGETIFAVGRNRTWEDLWKAGEKYDTFAHLRHHTGGFPMLCVDASEVFQRLCGRLSVMNRDQNLHPHMVLDAAYADTEKG